MAVLSTPAREAVFGKFCQEMSASRTGIPLVKADLRAVFNAADDRAEANASNYNLALPQPGRGALTAKDKARVLALVMDARWGGI